MYNIRGTHAGIDTYNLPYIPIRMYTRNLVYARILNE